MGFATTVTLSNDPPLDTWAFAMTTAKYGRKIAPAKQSHMSQPSTKMAATMQTTRMVIAIRYFTIRDLRSCSGDSPTVVMFWALSKVAF
jgi:hypothetical protein